LWSSTVKRRVTEARLLRRRRKKKKTARATRDAIRAITMPAIAGVLKGDLALDNAADGGVVVEIGLIEVEEDDELSGDELSGVV